MNREIKFRAWDNKNKQWFHITHENTRYCLSADSGLLFDSKWSEFPDATVMQYTGLLDKNGVEIYEGDIIRYASRNEPIYSYVGNVRWMENRWSITCKGAKNMEVIGNLHDNPELLKP
jgi:uncharacterized phage protein (TIGR01671 family)